MLIITTAVSGTDRAKFFESFRAYARRRKKKAAYYQVGQMIFEQAKQIGVNLTRDNVLNANPSVIASLRSAVFEKIARELPKMLREYDAVFVNIHAIFFWKNVFLRAWDDYYVRQFNPDLFVTLIDKSKTIKDNLAVRKQWEQSPTSNEDILLWQNVEVEMTASWANIARKDHFVVPTAAMGTLFRLVFEPYREIVYVSIPLTHMAGLADQRRVDLFMDHLQRYFTVFDPRDAEMIDAATLAKIDEFASRQIVNRDLYWLLHPSHKVIAYFPKVVSSPGVINELREAYETNKEVWLVYPPGEIISPFLSYYCSRIFRGRQDLFRYLASMPQPSRAKRRRPKRAAKRRGS